MNDDKYTLDEFLLDFGNIQTTFHSHYLGIEFKYKGIDYRMCKEPLCDLKYYLYKIVSVEYGKTIYEPNNYNYETLGICDTIDDLLYCTKIDNKMFVDVLFDEKNCEIIGFD